MLATNKRVRLPRFGVLGALPMLVLVVGVSAGHAGGGTPITACAQTVTTDALLTQDLVCTGDGIVVGASGITIDMKGFTIRGDRGASDYGIDNHTGYDDVTIKNGVVRNFYYGVFAVSDADTVRLSNLFVSGNSLDGILVNGVSASVKSSTVSGNVTVGIEINGDAAKVQSSTASGNGSVGIYVTGDAARVQSASASGNDSLGILVNGDAPLIKGNRTAANGFDGGASDLAGLGIKAIGYTTAPVGTNVARGNDDPAECAPDWLC
jgi:Right handed beta helix region